MSARYVFLFAAISGFVCVALGAFAAHLLQGLLSERMFEVLQTGIQYQMFHTLALLLVGVTMLKTGLKSLQFTAGLFLAGILLFSGSLYVLALSGQHWLGAVTPLGGVLFLCGWLSLGWILFRQLK